MNTLSNNETLHRAAHEKDMAVLNALLSNNNINVNFHDSAGFTPLHYAVSISSQLKEPGIKRVGNEKFVAALINANADVNLTNREGRTALMIAAFRGGEENLAAVQALLKADADINAVDKLGMTALHFAAACRDRGGSNIAEMLMRCGADLLATDIRGKMPVDYAAGNLRTHLKRVTNSIVVRNKLLQYLEPTPQCDADEMDMDSLAL